MSDNKECLWCCFFYPGWDDDEKRELLPEEVDIGQCRRYPPVAPPNHTGSGGVSWVFPLVDTLDWCGEFKPKPAQPSEEAMG